MNTIPSKHSKLSRVNKMTIGLSLGLSSFVFSGPSMAQKDTKHPPAKPTMTVPTTFATATLEPKSVAQVKGNNASGRATFAQSDRGVEITIEFKDVAPAGEHGLHIHDKGDCSAADASSAGPHFNPKKHKHGGPGHQEHHVGDLGNVTIKADGTAQFHFIIPKGDLEGLDNGKKIIGKSVVLHEKKDDLKTDPAGDSGARIACGVITAFSSAK